MGLFKRKKELEKEIDRLMEKNNELENKKYDLLQRICQLERQIESSNTLAITLKENQKLIEWIRKILETFGTCRTYGNQIQIPIVENAFSYTKKGDILYETKIIEIPAITIRKSTPRKL